MEEKVIPAEIIDVKEETKDVKTFRFKPLNGEKIEFEAGQFVFLYVDFDSEKGKERVRRAYSIASSPISKEYIDLTLKLTPGGKVTPYFLQKVAPRDRFDLSFPMGKFTYTEETGEEIVLIAGGSGIVPMKSIMQYCTDKNLDTKITLFYSVKNPEDIIYKNELNVLEKKNPNIEIIYTMTRVENNWQGHTGRIDKDLLSQYVGDFQNKTYYICGPLQMIRSIAKILMDLGVDRKKIKRELWV